LGTLVLFFLVGVLRLNLAIHFVIYDKPGRKGVTGGLGTSVGTGATVTNKGYNVDDIAGESIDGNVTLPFFKGLFSLDLFGNSNKLGLSNVGDVWPGANTRGIGLNAGVGTGAFVNWTYTFVTPVPEINNKYIYFSTYGH